VSECVSECVHSVRECVSGENYIPTLFIVFYTEA
jgi:hypothetical protein